MSVFVRACVRACVSECARVIFFSMPTLSVRGAGRRRGLSITFANVRGLRSNLASVEHYLTASRPNLLLLSETQLDRDSFSSKS